MKDVLKNDQSSRHEIIEKMIKELELSVEMVDYSELSRASLSNASDLSKKLGKLDAETRKRVADILFPIN